MTYTEQVKECFFQIVRNIWAERCFPRVAFDARRESWEAARNEMAEVASVAADAGVEEWMPRATTRAAGLLQALCEEDELMLADAWETGTLKNEVAGIALAALDKLHGENRDVWITVMSERNRQALWDAAEGGRK